MIKTLVTAAVLMLAATSAIAASCELEGLLARKTAEKRDAGMTHKAAIKVFRNAKDLTELERTAALNTVELVYTDFPNKTPAYIESLTVMGCSMR